MHEDPSVDLRFLQANERTLLAWVRTGLALMAFGFVLARLALWLELEGRTTGDRQSALFGGATIVALGAVCQIIGALRFVRARRALIAGERYIPGSAGPVIVAVVVALVAVAIIAYLFAT